MIKFTLEKEQLSKAIECFKPAIKEDLLRFQVEEGLIDISLDDMGNVLNYQIGGEVEVDESIPETYININILKNINSAISAGDKAEFNIDNEGGMHVRIGQTELNMSLPFHDVEINDEFEENESEAMLSDKVKAICERLKVVKSTGQTQSPTMVVGKTIQMGSNIAYSIIKEGYGLKELSFIAKPEFFSYFSNIYKFDDEVILAVNEDETKVMLQAGSATYILPLMSKTVQVVDVEAQIGELTSKAQVNRDKLNAELTKLKIPLAGMDEQLRGVKMEVKGKDLLLEVQDTGKRKSDSKVKVAGGKGKDVVTVSIDRLGETSTSYEEDFTLSWAEHAICLEDEQQKTFIVSVDDED